MAMMKSPLFKASIVGAFGGIAPELIKLVPQLSHDVLPTYGALLALLLLALFGLVTVIVFGEQDLKRALVLGAGAPAIIASLTATVSAPGSAMLIPLPVFSIHSTALAQPPSDSIHLKFVIMQNDTKFMLNQLWIRADGQSMRNYRVSGDTVIMTVPPFTKRIRVDLPSRTKGYAFDLATLDATRPIILQVSERRVVRDFWNTFGGAQVSEYEIEQVATKPK
jgi:hypothetical protein